VWYVDHWSLWLDVKLFVGIALMVLTRRGAEQGAAGQMPEFRPQVGRITEAVGESTSPCVPSEHPCMSGTRRPGLAPGEKSE